MSWVSLLATLGNLVFFASSWSCRPEANQVGRGEFCASNHSLGPPGIEAARACLNNGHDSFSALVWFLQKLVVQAPIVKNHEFGWHPPVRPGEGPKKKMDWGVLIGHTGCLPMDMKRRVSKQASPETCNFPFGFPPKTAKGKPPFFWEWLLSRTWHEEVAPMVGTPSGISNGLKTKPGSIRREHVHAI